MIKKLFFIILLIFSCHFSFSQHKQLSPLAEVSIITAGPGKVLYEGFGHSTIRIKDNDFDLAYNYGIFDFDSPNFYLNFTKGKLYYKLQSYPFHYFVRSYQDDKRWIKEQVLHLNQEEKQQFYEYLENNAKPENSTYLYDPFYNNCATILREITEQVLTNRVTFNNSHIQSKQSFRQLMNTEISWNNWGSFGINLALGSKLDNIATSKEHMFLPDYVYTGFKNATVSHNNITHPLIKKEQFILKFDEIKIQASLFSPFYIFSLLAFIGLFITYKDIKKNKRSRWLDFTLFFSTGIAGLLIVFLWFFTNHSTTPNNFNFLWAFAPNTIAAFYLLKKDVINGMKKYLVLVLILLLIIPIIWISKIQLFSFACLPIFILLAIRYIALYKSLLTSIK